MNKSRVKRFLVTICFVCGIVCAASGEKKEKRLVILHTNDTHSQIDPFTGPGKYNGWGGILRRKSLVDSVKNVEPAVLLVDAGDFSQGSPYYTFFYGNAETQLMNHLNYDAGTLGNHEFDMGLDTLSRRVSETNHPIVVSNYDVEQTPLAGKILKRYMKEINGIKVGIVGIGVNPDGLFLRRNYSGLRYLDPIESVNREARLLKSEGADVIIALSHLGFHPTGKDPYDDRQIARNSENIDIILGGHSHTQIHVLQREKNRNNKVVYIAQTGRNGVYVGEVVWDGSRSFGRLIPVDSRYDRSTDTVMSRKLAYYKTELAENLHKVVARSAVSLDVDRPQSRMTNLCADMLRDGFRGKCDFALLNIGAIRTGWRAGDITLWNVYAALPFYSKVVRLWLTGKEVKELFTQIAFRKGEAVSSEVSLCISPDGDLMHATIQNAPVDPNRLYCIVTIDYLAEGNDGLTALCKAQKVEQLSVLSREVILRQIEQLTSQGKLLDPKLDNRIVIKNEK